MAFSIKFKSSVWHDLKRIDRAQSKNILDKIESELSETAEEYPVLKGKFAGLRRYRVGNYRAIYTILEDSVLILRIAHRKEIHR